MEESPEKQLSPEVPVAKEAHTVTLHETSMRTVTTGCEWHSHKGHKGYKGKRPQSRRLTASLFINAKL
eukprot:1142500-Pelagomonas_calceolata.AAC.1